jgi:hypothetical protein
LHNFLTAAVASSVLHLVVCSFQPHSTAYKIIKVVLMDCIITTYQVM